MTMTMTMALPAVRLLEYLAWVPDDECIVCLLYSPGAADGCGEALASYLRVSVRGIRARRIFFRRFVFK